ncbi:hypothetical protein HOLleu_36336 [Holothuria leucospilota]|uniref:LRAT domain-containing protein n=1 Tax=Holothuria leucospilota TaxID=206669 RepID=A0A9Q1BEL3_HOLLE|nr:hypothetical protein HOLleu_36336 [Holothuria leucospilota]
MEGERQRLQNHHHKTGCRGDIKEYTESENGEVKGYFCSCCKEEWLTDALNKNPAPDGTVKPVDHHIVSMFCCLQVSDTGNFVQWKDVKETGGVLQPGDHVAWLRCISYWHHAIVEEVKDDEITVIEWSFSGIHRNVRSKWDLFGNCGYSPMYKVFYPEEVQQQNPPELVLLRARARVDATGYSLFSDNCEHFATFCKTGSHQCSQLLQLKVSLRAWVRRFVTSFIHIVAIVSFSESIERLAGERKDWLGALLILVTESIYLIIALCVTYRVDTRREEFVKKEPPSCTRACRCASIKAVCQSALLVMFASLFSVYITRRLDEDRSFSERQKTGCEIGFGVLGGMIGNTIGFILFAFIPYPCCRNEITVT